MMRREDARRMGRLMSDAANGALDLRASQGHGWTQRDVERCRLAAAWELLTEEQRKLVRWALADQSRAIDKGLYRDTLEDHGTAALDRAQADLLEVAG